MRRPGRLLATVELGGEHVVHVNRHELESTIIRIANVFGSVLVALIEEFLVDGRMMLHRIIAATQDECDQRE